MHDVRRHTIAVLIGVLLSLGPAVPFASATVDPGDSTPTTEVPSEPSEPTDPPVDDTVVDDTLVGAGDPDSDIDGAAAAIAVVGFVLLLAVAAWWMVRRSNPDAGPKPPTRPSGSPPSDLI